MLGFAICFTIYLIKTSKVIESKQKVTFDVLILLDEIKEELCMIYNDISQEKKIMFEKVGFKLPQGYLLYGPSGNGKTLLFSTVAGEAKIPFFFISGTDIVCSFVDQCVQNIHKFFQTARKKSPYVIFIDEIDTFGKQRINLSMGGELSNILILN